jgi:hypothetical protein
MTVINYMTSPLSCRVWYAAWENRPHRTSQKTNRRDITFVWPAVQHSLHTVSCLIIISAICPQQQSTRWYTCTVLMSDPVRLSGYYTYHQVYNSTSLCSAHYFIYVLRGSQNKQRLLHYTALIDWFYNRTTYAYCAVRAESLYVIQASSHRGISPLVCMMPNDVNYQKGVCASIR